MTVVATNRERLQIVQSLITGLTVEEIAAETENSAIRVRTIAEQHGYPHSETMRRAAVVLRQKCEQERSGVPVVAAPVPAQLTIEALLSQADKHSQVKIRTASTAIRTRITKLRSMIAEQAEAEKKRQAEAAAKQAALAKIKELEDEINRVRKAAGLKPRKGPASDRTGTRSGQTSEQHSQNVSAARVKQDEWLAERGITFDQVKEWAAKNGRPVNSSIISWAIREAWDLAQSEAGAA